MTGQRPKVIYLFGRPRRRLGPTGRDDDGCLRPAGVELDRTPSPAVADRGRTGVLPRHRLMTDTYSAAQVAKMLSIPAGRVRYWSRCGLIEPSGRRGVARFYTFQDLVALRVAKGLLDAGLSSRRVRRAVAALRQQLPRHCRPLAELRVYGDGDTVVVRDGDRPFVAESGQLLLDFSLGEFEKQVVQLAAPRRARSSPERRTAFEWYLEGCQKESNPEACREAEQAYRRAVELDPQLACAYTNLGNLRYRAGAVEDARALYCKALDLEPDQPEAFHNLGYLEYEEGRVGEAVRLFNKAVELSPEFGDAHLNLAMALVEDGNPHAARRHFARYLELEPEGPWADLARQHLSSGR